MDNPRPEKVAVVEEVRSRLDSASAAILTEYRGLTVSDIAELRKALEKAGASAAPTRRSSPSTADSRSRTWRSFAVR